MISRHNIDFKRFETMLKAEKEKVNKNIEVIKAEVDALATEENINDSVDMAELQIDNVSDQKILKQLEDTILEIDAALGRINDGSYGICEKTAKEIPVDRLISNPWARTVVDA